MWELSGESVKDIENPVSDERFVFFKKVCFLYKTETYGFYNECMKQLFAIICCSFSVMATLSLSQTKMAVTALSLQFCHFMLQFYHETAKQSCVQPFVCGVGEALSSTQSTSCARSTVLYYLT